jgi:hypothetical protein
MVCNVAGGNAVFPHDGEDVFKETIDCVLSESFDISVALKRNPDTEGITIIPSSPTAFACVPSALRRLRQHSPPSVPCNNAMV